jgi:ribonuclease BN (tRNA processing enzyme)
VLGRDSPLHVYGPPSLQPMTDDILSAYSADIHERIYGMEHANEQGYQVVAHEIQPGKCYEDDLIAVEAFAVDHGTWPAYGFKFTTPDKTIVISGDTHPIESVEGAATGCDILIHEVYSVAGLTQRPPEWQAYHRAMHTSTHELAAIANRTQPGLLVLVHQLLWGVSEDDLLAEIREHYAGPVAYGHDLDVF